MAAICWRLREALSNSNQRKDAPVQLDLEKENLLAELARLQGAVIERDAELLNLNQELSELSERLPVGPIPRCACASCMKKSFLLEYLFNEVLTFFFKIADAQMVPKGI